MLKVIWDIWADYFNGMDGIWGKKNIYAAGQDWENIYLIVYKYLVK